MTEPLPLFPLGSTLLPGQVVSLHVFEPRYRELLQHLTSEAGVGVGGRGPCFGVVAIRAGHEVGSGGVRELHGVGCVAEVVELERHEDGTSDLTAIGRERFRLVDIDADAGTPWTTGLVEWVAEVERAEEPVSAASGLGERADPGDPGDPGERGERGGHDDLTRLVEQVDLLFGEYLVTLDALVATAVAQPRPSRPTDPTVLSWLIAGAVVLHAPERQRLLEAPEATGRLRLLRTLLRRELLLLELAPSLPATDLGRAAPDPR